MEKGKSLFLKFSGKELKTKFPLFPKRLWPHVAQMEVPLTNIQILNINNFKEQNHLDTLSSLIFPKMSRL